MKYVYVIVYSYDYRSIADQIFFNSAEEAMNWKKERIANNECLNPISAYDVKLLENYSLTNLNKPIEK